MIWHTKDILHAKEERKMTMNKNVTRTLTAGIITFSLAATLAQTTETTAASQKINRRKATVFVGQTCRLKISGRPGKITWKSSNRKIASVNKKGLVLAKKAGTAKITGKSAKKKWICKITVKNRQNKPQQPVAPVPTKQPATDSPTDTPTTIPTKRPGTTNKPAATNRPLITPAPVPTKRPVTNRPTTTPVPTERPGTIVTENSAYAALNSLRSTYPEGMPLTNSYYYHSPRFGNGYGCYGFAAKLSDTVFGTSQPFQTHSSFDQIRVGDNIRIGNSHSVIVLTKGNGFITVVEGNYNSSVHWDRKITSASLSSSGFKVYTRY